MRNGGKRALLLERNHSASLYLYKSVIIGWGFFLISFLKFCIVWTDLFNGWVKILKSVWFIMLLSRIQDLDVLLKMTVFKVTSKVKYPTAADCSFHLGFIWTSIGLSLVCSVGVFIPWASLSPHHWVSSSGCPGQDSCPSLLPSVLVLSFQRWNFEAFPHIIYVKVELQW